MKVFKISFSACFLIVFLLATQAAALVIGQTTQQLVQGSDAVIRGQVETVESHWGADGDIYSQARIAVSSVIKGTCPEKTIAVEYMGGKIGETSLRVSGEPRFSKGEQVLLFIKSGETRVRGKNGFIYNTAFRAQGKYNIGSGGIAHKGNFTTLETGKIDNDLDVYALIKKIKNIQ